MSQESNDTFIIIKAKVMDSSFQKVNKKDRKPTSYTWTYSENLTYVNFLKENLDKFQSHQSRKKEKPFLQLSAILGTRKSIQVKSHHQKLMNKFHSLPNIILKMGQYLSKQILQKQDRYNNSTHSNPSSTIKIQLNDQSSQHICQQDSLQVSLEQVSWFYNNNSCSRGIMCVLVEDEEILI